MKFYFLTLGTILVVCVGCQMDGQQMVDRGEYVAPPASLMAHPGPMVDLAAPGIMPMMAGPPQRSFQSQTSQIRMTSPVGMSVGWQVGPVYAENQLTTPARYNFVQGATYRLKLTNIPDRESLVLYPTLQVYPTHPATDAYLSHNSIPVELENEDLDQVESNNFVTKVIYLPDSKYQELAIAGVETLVSTKLQPGVDPVAEAERRGTIMVILRMGNMDLEMPNQATRPIPEGADVTQVSYWADGNKGQHVPPMPIAVSGNLGVPGPMLMGGPGGPGRSAINPISGVAGTPVWGSPITTTPIGLPGPPHLPLGHKAGLRSHTIRNLSSYDLPEPTDSILIDVKTNPGVRVPRPVNHIEYTETHPTFNPGEVNRPRWNMQQ